MKKLLTLVLAMLCAACLAACGQTKTDTTHMGINAVVQEIDPEKKLLTVTDVESGPFTADKCVLDCAGVELFYVDYETDTEREIALWDLQVSDSVILGVKESALQAYRADGSPLKILQLQLGTQRLS